MMNAIELLEIVEQNNLLDGEIKFRPCILEVTPESCADAEQVRQQIKTFAPEQGWLCFQSKVRRFLTAESFTLAPDTEIILYGELKGKDGRALHIRQDGMGGWKLAYFSSREGDRHLREETVLLAETNPDVLGEARQNLKYLLYWTQDGAQGWRQAAAAFNGFKEERK
ncbi:MAG: hypothetical protein GY862_38960 [Gammaproteobacteria bacterium]|nr:hypothetical protein [Gammaproteobacteria bacterium]